jgi:insulysin
MVETTSNDIVKSICDKLNYRYIKLKNQMECILVSDSESQTSAATLRVESGNLKDPEGVNGLAHFCEHMLFLGTEKYPEENHYSKLILSHAGQKNAATSEDYTYYYFNIKNEVFGQAVDVFS